jgi:cytoskeletal protein CcmA (bactofilin family)
LAAPPGELVVGGAYTLESGETLEEGLVILGGSAILEEGSLVEGNILILGGSLLIYGDVEGDITVAGGYIMLGDTAYVNGDITTAGGTLDSDPQAVIEGDTIVENRSPFNGFFPQQIQSPEIRMNANPFWSGLWFLARVFILASLAVLLMLFFPTHTQRISEVVVHQPIISGALGLITLLVAPIVLVAIAITILLLPVSLVGVFLIVLIVIVGWMAMGLEVGSRLARMLKMDWAGPVEAGIGTFVLSLVLGSIGFIPCVGWTVVALVASMGFGAVLLTRFGTREYPETVRVPSQPATAASIESDVPE